MRNDWTEDEALDLLRQGYALDQVARLTGYRKAWLRQQRVPRQSLERRLRASLTRKRNGARAR